MLPLSLKLPCEMPCDLSFRVKDPVKDPLYDPLFDLVDGGAITLVLNRPWRDRVRVWSSWNIERWHEGGGWGCFTFVCCLYDCASTLGSRTLGSEMLGSGPLRA